MTTQIIVEHLRVVSHWDLVLNLEKRMEQQWIDGAGYWLFKQLITYIYSQLPHEYKALHLCH